MPSNVNGTSLLLCELSMHRVGPWRAEVTADTEEALSGAVEIDIEGVTFSGTVIPGRSGVYGGKASARIVGGKGGLSKALPAKNYAGGIIKVRGILEDLLREAGETLSDDAETAVLDRRLPKYERAEGLASHALTRLADSAGATWRVLRDGTIWIGVDTYPEADIEHEVIDEDWSAGITTIAVDSPELTPGVTFRGIQIELVVHKLTETKLRTEAHVSSIRTALDKFLGHIRRDIDYSRLYPARVSQKNADNTFQVTPDDDRIRGAGLNKVEMLGAPFYDATSGDRVMVGFKAGDPTRPFCYPDKFVGTQDVARKGDMVACGGPTTLVTFGPPGASAPMVLGAPYPMVFTRVDQTPPIPTPFLFGTITSGRPKVKA